MRGLIFSDCLIRYRKHANLPHPGEDYETEEIQSSGNFPIQPFPPDDSHESHASFGYGNTTTFAVIALDLGFDTGFDTGVATAIVSAQSIAALVGCSLFGISIAWLPPRFVTLMGALTFGLIPLMLVPKKYLFLTIFTLVYFGRTLVDYSVPTILRSAVPVDLAGPFNA